MIRSILGSPMEGYSLISQGYFSYTPEKFKAQAIVHLEDMSENVCELLQHQYNDNSMGKSDWILYLKLHSK